MWEGYQIIKLIHSWGATVGEPLSVVTRAKDFNRGRLRIIVQDPVWGHHLSLMKPQIIKKLNTELGGNLVRDIYFQVGEISGDCNQETQLRAGGQDKGDKFKREETLSLEFKRNLKRLKDMII